LSTGKPQKTDGRRKLQPKEERPGDREKRNWTFQKKKVKKRGEGQRLKRETQERTVDKSSEPGPHGDGAERI